MRLPALVLTLLFATPAIAAAPPPELWLAGGALQLCSDLAPRACASPPPPRIDAREPSQVLFDAAGIERALDPLLWDLDGARGRKLLRGMLEQAAVLGAGRVVSMADAEDQLGAACFDRNSRTLPAAACKQADRSHRRPWEQLLDEERAAILSALEVPQSSDGVRHRERAYPQSSSAAGGIEIVQGFVDAARVRAGGAVPRIAVVTASAQDPFDAVDMYLDLFRTLGAQVEWWPIDAALNQAVSTGRCATLDTLRKQQLRLAARPSVYPDLAQQQQQACESPAALENVPARVHGMFFSGGDQWRLRRALVDAHDQPNAWLLALQRAHAAGTLVVGGTSAGAAVQSAGAMISNGATAEALRSGASPAHPPQPGCDRASRCAAGTIEDRLTFWPAGGTGLAAQAIVDTHFSERGRELRLLTLMLASGTPIGYGVDETSALRITGVDATREVRAYGEHGGWVFERVHRVEGGGLEARVHYLAPGESFGIRNDGLSVPERLAVRLDTTSAGTSPPPQDALASAALRDAATLLASASDGELILAAGAGKVTLARTGQTRVWRAGNGRIGITHLQLRYDPASLP